MPFVRDLARGLLQIIYPGICGICGCSLGDAANDFCPACRDALTTDSFPTCPRCAASVGPFVTLDVGCSHCKDACFHFAGVVRLGQYEGVLRDVVLLLKQAHNEGLAENVGRLWFEHAEVRLRTLGCEVIVPVPLHWWRRWTRGYNQSEVLAETLAERLGVPCERSWLRRTRATPPQTRQTPTGRWDNMKGAFRAASDVRIRGRSILLVDDVLTTGSTCSEAARALHDAGAAHIHVAVLAKSTH